MKSTIEWNFFTDKKPPKEEEYYLVIAHVGDETFVDMLEWLPYNAVNKNTWFNEVIAWGERPNPQDFLKKC